MPSQVEEGDIENSYFQGSFKYRVYIEDGESGGELECLDRG